MRLVTRRVGPVSARTLRELDLAEKRHRGRIAAVDPVTRRYFLGDTIQDAFFKARAAFPDKRPFYFHRIGFTFVERLAGGLKSIPKRS